MSNLTPLTPNAIADINAGQQLKSVVLQVAGVKRMSSTPGQATRYRLALSDGRYLNNFFLIATQLNHFVESNQIEDFAIIRITNYTSSVVKKTDAEKNIIIILSLEVLHSGLAVGHRIGDPKNYAEVEKTRPEIALRENTRGNVPSFGMGGGGTGGGGSSSGSANASLDRSISEGLTHPIASLSPYQNRWVLKARVTGKSPMRTWSNSKGDGKLFSFDLKDESGEIRVTAFREQADKFFDMVEVDKVYYITKCQIKPANKQFNHLKNDYEMTMTNDSTMVPCEEDVDTIPSIQYDLVPISTIANVEPNAVVDVIGVVNAVSELQSFTARASGRDMIKREVTLVDQSGASINLTLWGNEAETFDPQSQAVILIKSAMIKEFGGGKSLSVGRGGSMKLNPQTEESFKLRQWFDNGGATNISVSVSARTAGGGSGLATPWVTLEEVKLNRLGCGDKPDYFQIKGMIQNVRAANAWYHACPQPDCNKKVVDQENGTFRCEKCNKYFDTFKYRLLLNMNISDWVSNHWMTLFNEQGEKLFGQTAQEVAMALEENRSLGDKYFSNITFKPMIFKLRVKMESFGDENRLRMTVVDLRPINHKEYNTHLVEKTKQLMGIGTAPH